MYLVQLIFITRSTKMIQKKNIATKLRVMFIYMYNKITKHLEIVVVKQDVM